MIVSIPLSPQKDIKEPPGLPERFLLCPFAKPAAGVRGNATVGSKSPERGGFAVHFVPPQASGEMRPQGANPLREGF